MIALSITLFIFVNIFRWAELADNTNVRTFKDYFNYNDKIAITLAFVWFLITLFVWLFLNFDKL
jgi:uncharacterized membrane protein